QQVPARVNDRGKDDEEKRKRRHETSVPAPAGAAKISTSPPLGFCPSGAAACYRGFRNARTGDGTMPSGTLVATQSINSGYVPRQQRRQPGLACNPMSAQVFTTSTREVEK